MPAKQADVVVKAERRSSRERAAPAKLDPSDTPAKSRASVKAAGAVAPASVQTPRRQALAARGARGDQDPLARRLADAESARDDALRSEESLAEALQAEVDRADGAEASAEDSRARERAASKAAARWERKYGELLGGFNVAEAAITRAAAQTKAQTAAAAAREQAHQQHYERIGAENDALRARIGELTEALDRAYNNATGWLSSSAAVLEDATGDGGCEGEVEGDTDGCAVGEVDRDADHGSADERDGSADGSDAESDH